MFTSNPLSTESRGRFTLDNSEVNEDSFNDQFEVNETQETSNSTQDIHDLNFEDIAQQISVSIVHDNQSIRVELEPEELGRLEIRVVQQGDQYQLSIQSMEASTGEFLEKHRQSLMEYLSEQGFEFSSIEFDSYSESEQRPHDDTERDNNRWYRNSESESESPPQQNPVKGLPRTIGSDQLKIIV
ncbi:MAG: flagellar hook-length control protein FliK [Pirellulaceae bacterium]